MNGNLGRADLDLERHWVRIVLCGTELVPDGVLIFTSDHRSSRNVKCAGSAVAIANGSGSERPQAIAPRIPPRFNLVLLKGTGTAAFGSEPALAVIEAKNDLRSGVKVVRMVGGVEVLCCVVTGRKLHWSRSLHHKPRVFGVQRKPAHVCVVSMFLRHDVGDILVRDGAFVQIDKSGSFPVTIVFEWTTAEPT